LDFEIPKNWFEAFELLKDVIRQSKDKKKTIFIDELSWMDTPKSDLIMALENFWNGWASGRKDVMLIVCSSVTSWMINKVIHNKGGLYNRLTTKLQLDPLNLSECKEYSEINGLEMSMNQIIEAYMILGGIPYYWGFLEKGLSLSQNVDKMFFSKKALLDGEFEHLFSSLFKQPDDYMSIIKALSKKKVGLTRNEIIESTGLTGSGAFSKKLLDLENSGFIRGYIPFQNKKKDMVYQIIDPFVLFYYHFLKNKPSDVHFWTNQLNTSKINAWNGLAFERVCLWHVEQIKRALGISGVLCDVATWNCKADPNRGIAGSQVDLLIVRNDNVINILEMKFSSAEYAIDKSTNADLARKREDFRLSTKTKSAVHITMVTPYGLMKNSYSGNIQSEVVGEDLFVEC
jgi:hypothetical protein